jgi:ATP-dependent DNA helicase RecG
VVPRGGRVVLRARQNLPIATAFASTDELTPDAAAGAPLRSLPRPSRLLRDLGLQKKVRDAALALGLESVGDLLEHLPREHADRRATTPVNLLALDEDATVSVLVRSVAVKPMRQRGRWRIEAKVSDETGPLVAVWFGRPRFVAE